ncbi:hypothetical protein [Alistipes ihumii]|jgi:hypothetical protein|uniref:Uncharacterized protein n=1 Tax=Alistipes ihumii AP11 TaxID=1211813 RepID=A0ABY5UZB9_9BACT|nr:hypothetical protein [Alistipes ihumii]MBS6704722.1 hypothetical protein [Alistipes indistinctus]UWN56829.1 hypothetical protein NQ491_09250 [Alistipes ihumii AP11]
MPNRTLFQQITNYQILTAKQNISPSRNPSQNDRAIIQNGKPEEIPAAVFRDFPAYGSGLIRPGSGRPASVAVRIVQRIVRDKHAIHPS